MLAYFYGTSQLLKYTFSGLCAKLPNIEPGSKLPNRIALLEKEGKQGIPYLRDPNIERGMFESDEIMAYLEGAYARDANGAQVHN